MIRSMTAFAGEEHAGQDISLSVEIRCVNSRHLDLSVRLPATHAGLEEVVREVVSSAIQRGRVEVRVGVKLSRKDIFSFEVNEDLADAYYRALNRIRERFDLTDPVTLEQMARFNGIIEPVEAETDVEGIRTLLKETMLQAICGLNRMRDEEGAAIAGDLRNRLAIIEQVIEEIENRSTGLLERSSARLIERVNEITRGIIEIDQGRIAQEAAILADKSDISEEVTRARSHLNQFRLLMDGSEPAGKPLNFLLQEFTREFNTMGSKAGNAEIAHMIVMAKTELEKIREQVQNVE
jgi:uncharacterized protein (TIGR00255 family)